MFKWILMGLFAMVLAVGSASLVSAAGSAEPAQGCKKECCKDGKCSCADCKECCKGKCPSDQGCKKDCCKDGKCSCADCKECCKGKCPAKK